jgi:hypothetical protein
MKKNLTLLVVLIIAVVFLFACSQQSDESGSTGLCSKESYKEEATSVMEDFQGFIVNIELDDPNSLDRAERELRDLLVEAKGVKCAYKYPLKQETLEYSIIHMIDAVQYAKAENLSEMQTSLNKVELNVEQFYNWSVDMGG